VISDAVLSEFAIRSERKTQFLAVSSLVTRVTCDSFEESLVCTVFTPKYRQDSL